MPPLLQAGFCPEYLRWNKGASLLTFAHRGVSLVFLFEKTRYGLNFLFNIYG
jgi:hypothetical protein